MGDFSYDNVGDPRTLSGAGDVNVDGKDDLFLGSINHDDNYTNQGKVSLFFGCE